MKTEGWRFIDVGGAMLLAAGAVWAQEATAEGGPEEDLAGGDESVAMGDRTIEEITVTARKTEESLDTIPLTMRAFTADDIKQQRVEVGDGHRRPDAGAVHQ